MKKKKKKKKNDALLLDQLDLEVYIKTSRKSLACEPPIHCQFNLIAGNMKLSFHPKLYTPISQIYLRNGNKQLGLLY